MEILQNCGDILKIEKCISGNLYKGRFLKYPCEVTFLLSNAKAKKVNNPQIEVIEFINKEWPQNCGDILKIIGISKEKDKYNRTLFECEFIKYPYRLLCSKQHIKRGVVNNPQIENDEFINREWPQNCGDIIYHIEKSDKQIKKGSNFLYKVKFKKYPYETLALKSHIISGSVENYNLPWKSKENLKKYLKDNFENYKPTLEELCNKLNISYSHISNLLTDFDLKNYINYWIGNQEKELRNYIKEITGQTYNSKNNKNFEIDIFIKDKNLGFEYNGNYWHCSLFKTPIYHQEKTLFFQSKGISLIHIFEFEWLNKQTICKSLIKAKLGLFDKKIGARQCEIRELKNQEYQNFCNKNHLQGEAGARVKLGLYYKDELIQIMSFGSPRFTSEYEWEIIRECSKLGYFIIGGKQRLWNYFIKKYHPNNCISYCDFSKFTGESYIKLGFKQLRLNKPGFWWYDEENKEVYWRNPVKHKEMVEAGYLKIYDCGQLVFSWNKV